jgi:PAS domain S-box-containing protein
MPPSVRPTGVERTFDRDEIIVTKTDLQGRITYANDVFLRISALTEDEALGQPHNVIRHPDMPGGVFRLMWETLAQGREMFAYVQNLATDGAHYWVFAHVTPTVDVSGTVVGYHSNRRSPSRAGVLAAQDLYRSVLAEERRTSNGPEAAARGLATLRERLTQQGTSYDELVWSITKEDAA